MARLSKRRVFYILSFDVPPKVKLIPLAQAVTVAIQKANNKIKESNTFLDVAVDDVKVSQHKVINYYE